MGAEELTRPDGERIAFGVERSRRSRLEGLDEIGATVAKTHRIVAADDASGGAIIGVLQRFRAERAQTKRHPSRATGLNPQQLAAPRSTRARMAQAGSIARSGVPA